MSKRIEIGEYVSVNCEKQRISSNGIVEAIGMGIVAIRTESGFKHSFRLQNAIIERLGNSVHATNITNKRF